MEKALMKFAILYFARDLVLMDGLVRRLRRNHQLEVSTTAYDHWDANQISIASKIISGSNHFLLSDVEMHENADQLIEKLLSLGKKVYVTCSSGCMHGKMIFHPDVIVLDDYSDLCDAIIKALEKGAETVPTVV